MTIRPTLVWFGLLLGGCQIHVSGLLPLSPSPHGGWVDSLTPTLKWEAFRAGDEAEITEVVYDLRIMLAGGNEIVYSKDGLSTCEHPLETPLEPGRRYSWTVRARFRSHGERRLTQWTSISNPGIRQPLTPVPEGEPLPLRIRANPAPR